MRKNNLTSWSYTDSLECLLFFAQRMDELLFHHTTDTYRYSALSIRGLAAEYCAVYRDVNAGILNKKNLNHIIDEFACRIKCDDIAKGILASVYRGQHASTHAISRVFSVIFNRRTSLYASFIFLENP